MGGDNLCTHNTTQHSTIQYNTIQYNTIQYNTIQYNTIQYNTIQYNTTQCRYNTLWISVLCMRSKAWLAARVPLRLARLPHTASSAQRSRRLRSTRGCASPSHARERHKNVKHFSMGTKLRHPTVHYTAQHLYCRTKR
jgi:hypothetical protein